MANLNFDISEWYNEDDLDYRTPEFTHGSPSASPARVDQQRSRPGLPLLQLADWNPNLRYDEFPPTCIHYSIEWKLLLKKGRLSKLTNDTEQNLVLAPGAFWDQTLKPKLLQLLAKKTPRNKCYELDETNVVVSVTDRSQRDLTKRFDELDIDWGVVENQLAAWSHLLRDRRQLRIDISFICKEETTQQVAVRTQQTTRRGGVTATQLAERAELLEEQEAAGLTSVWREVYSLMRCTGPPCSGTYCWRDPDNRKHYKLDTSVLTKLIDYAEEGNMLRTHADVPPWIRELIYAKEQQDLERRKRKRQGSFSESLPPIHITNIIPTRNQDSVGCPTGSTPETALVGEYKAAHIARGWRFRNVLGIDPLPVTFFADCARRFGAGREAEPEAEPDNAEPSTQPRPTTPNPQQQQQQQQQRSGSHAQPKDSIMVAKVLYQTYHYMIISGLAYGYVSSGDCMVFLALARDAPDILLFHLLSKTSQHARSQAIPRCAISHPCPTRPGG